MKDFDMILGDRVLVERICSAKESRSFLAIKPREGSDTVSGRDGDIGWYGKILGFGIDSKWEREGLRIGDIVLVHSVGMDSMNWREENGKKTYHVPDEWILGQWGGTAEELEPKELSAPRSNKKETIS